MEINEVQELNFNEIQDGNYRNEDRDLDGFEVIKVQRGFTEIEPIYETIRHFNAFICGGYVRYMCSPKRNPVPAGDVDIYSNNTDVFEEMIQKFKSEGLRVKHSNEMSITFSHPISGKFKYCPTIQIIKPVREGRIISVGNMDTILQNFDFSVVRCGLISPTEAKVDLNFTEDEKNLKLRLKNIHCPISSTLRCMKYSRKGYWLKPFEAMKLFIDWEERDQDYKIKIIDYLNKTKNDVGLDQTEIEEMEAMMRID